MLKFGCIVLLLLVHIVVTLHVYKEIRYLMKGRTPEEHVRWVVENVYTSEGIKVIFLHSMHNSFFFLPFIGYYLVLSN